MNKFGDDRIQALNEALTHAKGDGAGIVQSPAARKEGLAREQPPDEGKKREQVRTNELSLEECYRAMAAEKQDWSDIDATVGDGLDP